MVKVYGASDDLVCIEGSTYQDNEIDCYDREVRIRFTDGTVIRVGYGKGDKGIWQILVEETGTAEYTRKICDDENAAVYSDIFCIDAEVEAHTVLNGVIS